MSPLIFVCDWIPPAFGAVGQYAMAEARAAAAAGREVTLIGLGEEASDNAVALGEGRLRIMRVAATPPDKGNLLKRASWALATNHKLLRAMMSAARDYRRRFQCCEVKVTGSPPFLSYLILLWRVSQKGVSITYRITDFYPETAFAAGKALMLRPLTPLIHQLRRTADRIEAISRCQARRLAESGVASDRIDLVRDASPVAIKPATRPAPRPFAPEHVVLLYSGNLGVAHDWLTFAEAYKRHVVSGGNRVRLWLNATGVGVGELKAYCAANGLPVHVSPPVPLSELAGVLVAADAHLVTLKEPFWGYVIPSKIYGCIESQRPVVYVGPAQSEVHDLISGDPHSHSVRNGDVEGCYRALETLKRVGQGGVAGLSGSLSENSRI